MVRRLALAVFVVAPSTYPPGAPRTRSHAVHERQRSSQFPLYEHRVASLPTGMSVTSDSDRTRRGTIIERSVSRGMRISVPGSELTAWLNAMRLRSRRHRTNGPSFQAPLTPAVAAPRRSLSYRIYVDAPWPDGVRVSSGALHVDAHGRSSCGRRLSAAPPAPVEM